MTGEEKNLPSTAITDDLDVNIIARLVLVKTLDELLVHPRVELTHPSGSFVRDLSSSANVQMNSPKGASRLVGRVLAGRSALHSRSGGELAVHTATINRGGSVRETVVVLRERHC